MGTNRNRTFAIAVALGLVVLVGVYLTARLAGEMQQADETWRFVADIEVRDSEGTPVAVQAIRADECVPDAEIPDGCAVSWVWEETFPTGSVEWYLPRFEITTAEGITKTVKVPTYAPQDCPIVDPYFCKVRRESGEPSAECLAALAGCGIERDERGYYNNGPVAGGPQTRHGVFFEPLAGEWYDDCPVPPPTTTPYIQPTYTPEPTYTPRPTPTCRPTWTPPPAPTPYPTSTPWPTPTEYPTQPPW